MSSEGQSQVCYAPINRRDFVASALFASSVSACGKEFPRFFDIEWDEEVLLHDGRIIWVHMKRTYERLNRSDERYGIHRDTEISFDMGGQLGRFTRKFRIYDVAFLHEKDGLWYLALSENTGTPPMLLITWEKSVLLLKPDGTLTAFARADLPSDFKTINLMPPTPDSAVIAKFHNQKLTIREKNQHWQEYLRSAGDGPETEISRK